MQHALSLSLCTKLFYISPVVSYFYLRNAQHTKEGCNRGHSLSAAIKLGSLEKTVIASLLHSDLHSVTTFLWKK